MQCTEVVMQLSSYAMNGRTTFIDISIGGALYPIDKLCSYSIWNRYLRLLGIK